MMSIGGGVGSWPGMLISITFMALAVTANLIPSVTDTSRCQTEQMVEEGQLFYFDFVCDGCALNIFKYNYNSSNNPELVLRCTKNSDKPDCTPKQGFTFTIENNGIRLTVKNSTQEHTGRYISNDGSSSLPNEECRVTIVEDTSIRRVVPKIPPAQPCTVTFRLFNTLKENSFGFYCKWMPEDGKNNETVVACNWNNSDQSKTWCILNAEGFDVSANIPDHFNLTVSRREQPGQIECNVVGFQNNIDILPVGPCHLAAAAEENSTEALKYSGANLFCLAILAALLPNSWG